MTAGRIVTGKRNVRSKPKVKTGCATCRIRKVKCDESRPYCQKCVGTGRTCDGYESPFRVYTSQPSSNAHARSIKSSDGSESSRLILMEISPKDIDLLNRYFSTKTIFDVDLGCNEEARQVLEASLTDPPIKHALASLKTLREQIKTSEDANTSVIQQAPNYDYGLSQYCMALRGLAFNLASPGRIELKSALFCCQIFISIEQVRGNHAAMAGHIIQGLRIMHQYHARPSLSADKCLVPAYQYQLPLLDVFVIKLFAAPCKFADAPATIDQDGTAVNESQNPISQQPMGSRHNRTIAPDIRTELTKTATSTLDLLDKVSNVDSVESAFRLLPAKQALLDRLDGWLLNLSIFQKVVEPPSPEPLSVSFLRLFHQILKIVLLGTLDSSPDLSFKLRAETDRLQEGANDVGERVKAYWASGGSIIEQRQSCEARSTS